MEYCAGGDLSQLISDRKEKRIKGTFNALLDLNFVLKVFRQLLSALKELHHNDQVSKFRKKILKPSDSVGAKCFFFKF